MIAKLTKVESIERLDELFRASFERPVVLFKHSNRCGISSHVLEETSSIDGEINIVVIQDHRPISNAIAERTGHRHQSPQAFVIRNGETVYHATHYGISTARIAELVKG